jgi:phosphoglycolate phosphatase-like HAD superfamily hydrolase
MEPRASIDVVMLDFDGTVADTMGFLTETAARLLSNAYGMAADKARRAYIGTSGLPFVQQMEIIRPGDSRNTETVRQFEEAKQTNLERFHLYPDAIPAVTALRQDGIRVCVSSSNREDLIRRLLAARGLEVDLVLGFRAGFEKGRDHFDFAQAFFKVESDRLLFVGDSHRDGLIARSAGVRFVLRSGLLDAKEIRNLLPGVLVIESLGDLLLLLGIATAQDMRGSTQLPEPF